jgi:hypothetical protein
MRTRNCGSVDSETATNCHIMSTTGWTVGRWHDPGRYSGPDGDVGYVYSYRPRHLNTHRKLVHYTEIGLRFL